MSGCVKRLPLLLRECDNLTFYNARWIFRHFLKTSVFLAWENPMTKEPGGPTVRVVAKSRTQPSDWACIDMLVTAYFTPSFPPLFPWCLYSVPGSRSWHHVTFSCHITLGSSWQWTSLRLSLFSMTFLRCFKMPVTGIYLMGFSHPWRVMGLGEKVNAVVIHTTYHCWHWPWSLGPEVCLSDFFTEKLLLFSPTPFLYCPFRRKSLFRKPFLGGSPHLGNKESLPVSSRGRIFT